MEIAAIPNSIIPSGKNCLCFLAKPQASEILAKPSAKSIRELSNLLSVKKLRPSSGPNVTKIGAIAQCTAHALDIVAPILSTFECIDPELQLYTGGLLKRA